MSLYRLQYDPYLLAILYLTVTTAQITQPIRTKSPAKTFCALRFCTSSSVKMACANKDKPTKMIKK